jgi:hypothetical protein
MPNWRAAMAIGVPSKNVDGRPDSGSVLLFPAASGGLLPDKARSIDEGDVGGVVTAGNRFGAATAMGDLTGDGERDLIIGAPGANHSAGRAYVVPFDESTAQFNLASAVVIGQGLRGIDGVPEPGDQFGTSAVVGRRVGTGQPWLAVGAPGEDVGLAADAGAVSIIPWGTSGASDRMVYQGSGAPGSADTGDRLGTVLAGYVHVVQGTANIGVAAGAPGEDIDGALDAGEVDLLLTSSPSTLPGSATGLALRQGAEGVLGAAEAGDHFGAAIVTVFSYGGVGQLAIGVPDEDIGATPDAGAVVIWRGFGRTSALWYQGHDGLGEQPEAGDRFGAALASDLVSLLIGAPREDIGAITDAGVVHALYASGGNPFGALGSRVFSQGTPGIPGADGRGDRFGAAFGALAYQSGRLAIVAPGEGRARADAGGFTTLDNDADGRWTTAGAQFIDQETPGVPGSSGVGDQLGLARSTRV